MVRTIDKLPDPPSSTPKIKLVVASCSRYGALRSMLLATLGVYQALKILGYRPYHLYELCMFGGDDHWEIMIQGYHALYNRFASAHLQPRYTKKEFDKWFAGYDALVELPAYFGTDCLEAYAQDPDVRFILTERTPKSWAKSYNNFVGGIVRAIESPPMNVLRYFNRTLTYFCILNADSYNVYSDFTRPGDPGNEEALMKNYAAYVADVKRIIPAERMLVVKIEDGLGWEQICPFLGKEVPKGVEYPRGVEHEDVKDKWLKPKLISATINLVLTVTLPIALGGWAWWRWS